MAVEAIAAAPASQHAQAASSSRQAGHSNDAVPRVVFCLLLAVLVRVLVGLHGYSGAHTSCNAAERV